MEIVRVTENELGKIVGPVRKCLVCDSYVEVNHSEFYNQPVSICNHCKEAIMKAREFIKGKE